MYGALLVLRVLARKYEFRDDVSSSHSALAMHLHQLSWLCCRRSPSSRDTAETRCSYACGGRAACSNAAVHVQSVA